MPELPDIAVYVECLAARIIGHTFDRARIEDVFLLRSVEPRAAELEGQRVTGVRRLGKRVVIELEGELFLVLHLMIAGRLHWFEPGKPARKPSMLAAFEFSSGTLVLTEAGTKRRASLHLVRGEAGLAQHDRGGIEPLEADARSFEVALARENHTLKRALTDPRIFSGIGNSYSDEILHCAQLSPLKLTSALSGDETARLHSAVRSVLSEWTEKSRKETGAGFPKKVTAFREGMAVHGRFKQPCPRCGSPVQRIVYAENECNYCARCQTGGKLLADRALSRLLKQDWPRTIDELEDRATSTTPAKFPPPPAKSLPPPSPLSRPPAPRRAPPRHRSPPAG